MEKVIISPVKDIPEAMRWRKEVIEAVFGVTPSASLLEANLAYYKSHVPDGRHVAVKASLDGVDVGCGAVCFQDELPSPDNPDGKCGYIMNIYVKPQFRKRGIAHHIVVHLVDLCKRRGCCKIYLETTDVAASLYRSLGFVPLDSMMHIPIDATRQG